MRGGGVQTAGAVGRHRAVGAIHGKGGVGVRGGHHATPVCTPFAHVDVHHSVKLSVTRPKLPKLPKTPETS